jgi:hypothetical protein
MTSDNENARPAANGTGAKQAGDLDASVAQWAEVYECADRWVRWTARRRWPTHLVNDQVWAMSVTSWELHGRRAA